ncbi:hypothetical protein ACFL31_01065 [Candidatus Margulisiibacteriota bacterium]
MDLKKQKLLGLLFIIAVSLFMVSCSSPEDKVEVSLEEQEAAENIDEHVPSPEASRKPLYVYGDKAQAGPDTVTLKLNSEPLLLTGSYVRLVGVVSGGRPVHRSSKSEGGPIALIEVGGRGLILGKGESIKGYKLFKIGDNSINLVKEGKS